MLYLPPAYRKDPASGQWRRSVLRDQKRFLLGAARASVTRRKGAGAAVVTLDDFSGTTQASGASPWTGLTHALGATANRIDVMVATEGDTGDTTVTAGGIAMTAGAVAGSGDRTVRSFWLDDTGSFPSAGSVSVVVTPTNSVSGYLGVWSANGAQSGAPSRSDTMEAAGGAGGANSLADVPAGSMVLGGAHKNTNSPDLSVTGEDFEDFPLAQGASGGQDGLFCRNMPATEASVTHAWAGGAQLVALMLEILAA